MNLNSDWIALLHELNAAGARYMIVGAHAVMLYSRARGTKDFDIWVARDEENAARVYEALATFGASLEQLRAEDLQAEDLVFQMGVAPGRVDIITSIDGVEFEKAWARRTQSSYGSEPAPFISLQDLLTNKRTVGRLQDLADVETLEKDAL